MAKSMKLTAGVLVLFFQISVWAGSDKTSTVFHSELRPPLTLRCYRVLDRFVPQVMNPVATAMRALNVGLYRIAEDHKNLNQWIDSDDRLFEKFSLLLDAELAKLKPEDRVQVLIKLVDESLERANPLHPLLRNFDSVWLYFNRMQIWESFIKRLRENIFERIVSQEYLSVNTLFATAKVVATEAFYSQNSTILRSVFMSSQVPVYVRAGAYDQLVIYLRRQKNEIEDRLTMITVKELEYKARYRSPYPLAVSERRKLLAITAHLNWLLNDLPRDNKYFRTNAQLLKK